MTSKVILPFNHQPATGASLLSNQTISAGKYARARPMSPICKLNSTYVWQTTQSGAVTLSQTTHYYTIPTGFTGVLTSNATATIKYLSVIGGTGTAALLASETNYNMAGSGVAVAKSFINGVPENYVYTVTEAVYNHLGFAISISSATSTVFTLQHCVDPGWMWVKAGDVLDGAWIIELYNELT